MPKFKLNALSRLSDAIAAAQAKAREQAKDAFAAAFKSFFAAHPEVSSLSWRQYTPYFNDGDPCIFSVHAIYASVAPEDEDGLDSWDLKDTNPELAQDLKALEAIDDDLFLAAFGDHVRITVTKDGIDVADCNHD